MYEPDRHIPPGLGVQRAREILGAIVKTALQDWRSGAEPRATEAARWLDEAVGDKHWRDAAQEPQQFQRARPR
jgi:hypothetical protein